MPDPDKKLNVYNSDAIDAYLHTLGKQKPELEKLLVITLKKAILKDKAFHTLLAKLPADAPGWLRDKWQPDHYSSFNAKPDAKLHSKVRHVADWLGAALRQLQKDESDPAVQWLKDRDDKGRPRKLLKFGSLDQAHREANKAMKKNNHRLHEKIGPQPEAVEADDTVEIIKRLDNGFCIVRLKNEDAADIEGKLMGHCVGDGNYDDDIESGKTIIYSLRDYKNQPHATMEIDTKTNTLKQCKGKQNQPPDESYFEYLKDFIVKHKFKLDEDIINTGVILWQERYYSVYNLPDNLVIDDSIDFSLFKKHVTLPKGLVVHGLITLPYRDYQTVPDGISANRYCIQNHDNENRLHNITLSDGSIIAAERIWNDKKSLITEKYEYHGATNDVFDKNGLRIPAIRIWNHNGILKEEGHYKNAALDNVIDENNNIIPARQRWFENGHLEAQFYYTEGQSNDIVLDNGERIPAETRWYETGELETKLYLKNHNLNDVVLENGDIIAAHSYWNPAGILTWQQYYYDGELSDRRLKTGHYLPAERKWDNLGNPISATSYNRAVRVHNYNKKEILELDLQLAQLRQKQITDHFSDNNTHLNKKNNVRSTKSSLVI